MKRRVKGLLCTLFAVMLVLCIAAALSSEDAYATDFQSFSGTVYASQLEGVEHVVVAGDMNLILREGDYVTVKSFRFDYADGTGTGKTLTISGSNAGSKAGSAQERKQLIYAT